MTQLNQIEKRLDRMEQKLDRLLGLIDELSYSRLSRQQNVKIKFGHAQFSASSLIEKSVQLPPRSKLQPGFYIQAIGAGVRC